MGDRSDESDFDLWAGMKFDLVRGEICVVGVDGNRERAPVFEAVIDAMRWIPYSPERADEIRAGAFNICSAAMFASMANQPNLQQNRGGTAADLKELQDIHDRCFELAHRLYQLNSGSRSALEKHDPRGLRKFQKEVARWSDFANEAFSDLNESEHRPSRKGRPPKEVEAAIRPAALREFEHLTGEPVAPGHPDYTAFRNFFCRLFHALNVDSKYAGSQARTAVMERDGGPDKISK